MLIGSAPSPITRTRTVKLSEATVYDTFDFKQHEFFGNHSMSKNSDHEFSYPGIVWSKDLDPDPLRSYRESLPEQPSPGISTHRRVVDAVADASNPHSPTTVTILMESRPEHQEQLSQTTVSQWENGRPVRILRHERQDGEPITFQEAVLNPETQTITFTTTTLD